MTTAELADDPQAAIVEGVDIDLVAKTVRACAGVSDLVDGPFGDSTSYLPGRRVTGVSVNGGTVRVSVRAKWGVPASDLLEQITSALKPILANRRIEVVVADVDDPPSFAAQPPVAVPAGSYLAVPADAAAAVLAAHEAGSSNDPPAASHELEQPPRLL
jgi:hypothetical protein